MFYTRRVFYTEDVIDRADDGDEGWIIIYLTEYEVCRWRVETGRVKGIGKSDFASFYLEGRAEKDDEELRRCLSFCVESCQRDRPGSVRVGQR